MGDMGRVNGFTPEQIHECRTWAEIFQRKGYKPLPSRSDEKRPMMLYAHLWDQPLPPVSELWTKYPSGNMQIMTGRNVQRDGNGLCVVDVDGPEGIEAFNDLCIDRGGRYPYTWESVNNRSEGRHLWFRLPRNVVNGPPVKKRRLWGVWEPEAKDGKGAWRKRANIELLCDYSLVMSPPSIKPPKEGKEGFRYQFIAGKSPVNMAKPAIVPSWLLYLEAPEIPRPVTAPVLLERGKRRIVEWDGEWNLPVSPKGVREAIRDKIGLVRQWGVRVASEKPNANGWVRCHAIDRLDANPSASFNPTTGRYWQAGWPDNRSICLFRLGVERGIYGDWREACIDLSRIYLPQFFRSKKSG